MADNFEEKMERLAKAMDELRKTLERTSKTKTDLVVPDKEASATEAPDPDAIRAKILKEITREGELPAGLEEKPMEVPGPVPMPIRDFRDDPGSLVWRPHDPEPEYSGILPITYPRDPVPDPPFMERKERVDSDKGDSLVVAGSEVGKRPGPLEDPAPIIVIHDAATPEVPRPIRARMAVPEPELPPVMLGAMEGIEDDALTPLRIKAGFKHADRAASAMWTRTHDIEKTRDAYGHALEESFGDREPMEVPEPEPPPGLDRRDIDAGLKHAVRAGGAMWTRTRDPRKSQDAYARAMRESFGENTERVMADFGGGLWSVGPEVAPMHTPRPLQPPTSDSDSVMTQTWQASGPYRQMETPRQLPPPERDNVRSFSFDNPQGLQEYRDEVQIEDRVGRDMLVQNLEEQQRKHKWEMNIWERQHDFNQQAARDMANMHRRVEWTTSAYERNLNTLTDTNV